MKLTTSIQPRKDGTVSVTLAGSEPLVFRAGASGDLECEVTGEEAIAALLQTGNFYPADEADFDAALSVIKQPELEPEPEPEPASVTAPAPRRGKSRAS